MAPELPALASRSCFLGTGVLDSSLRRFLCRCVCLRNSGQPLSPCGTGQFNWGGSPSPLESVCCALCHPAPRVKDRMKTRLQFPSWHLTPIHPARGLCSAPSRVLQGVGVGGMWPEIQSLHGRSRSQGCGSQDPPRQVSLENTGRWGPGQDSSPHRRPQHTHSMHTCSCHGARLHDSWPHPWRPHSLPAGLPPSWDTAPAWSQLAG